MIDLTGKRFGKLIVLERDYNYPKKGTYWKCQCDCGNIISARKDQLTREKNPKRSCGCDLKEKISLASCKNEIGNRYGKLTVLSRAEDKRHGEAAWLCQCDCGNTCIVAGTHIRNGSVQSCGCKKYESKNGIDETGNKYGLLTVLYRSDFTRNGKIYWHCKCDCGNECDVQGTYLRNGISLHCGCKKSAGEIKISNLLKENNIQYIKEYTFPDLVSENNSRLRFDFAILNDKKQLQYLIEYDGKQHFDQSCFDQSDIKFALVQKYDKMKNDYCKINNIPLIRINYTQLTKLTIDDLLIKGD